jgi:hypothetical protein
MSQERMGEIERLLTVAEDELSYVQKQRQFLLDQIASLKRERENSVFVDDNLEPYPDQWAYLSSARRLAAQEVEQLVQSLSRSRQELGARSSFAALTDASPWEQKRFGDWNKSDVTGPLPESVRMTLADQLNVPFWHKRDLVHAFRLWYCEVQLWKHVTERRGKYKSNILISTMG